MTVFANPNLVSQSWYVAARSKDVAAGRVRTYHLLNRRIAVYRDHQGAPHALDAACPHLGADLGQGRVIDDRLRCAFHHWCIGPDGAAVHDASRRVRAYPMAERWGLLWLFNGPRPLFPLPEPPDGQRWRVFATPPRFLRCHPHLVVGNGLDTTHLETLHGMQFTAAPRIVAEPPYRVSSIVEGHPRSSALRRLTGTIRATFTTTGGNLAWAAIEQRAPFHVLFSAQPVAGGSRTQMLAFLPRGPSGAVRALALLYTLLHNDRRVLESLDFQPRFTAQDQGLAAMAEAVNACGVW